MNDSEESGWNCLILIQNCSILACHYAETRGNAANKRFYTSRLNKSIKTKFQHHHYQLIDHIESDF